MGKSGENKMSIVKEQLRANVVSLYGGYESEIKELSRCFGISEKEVRQYIEEENELHRKLYGSNLWENEETEKIKQGDKAK